MIGVDYFDLIHEIEFVLAIGFLTTNEDQLVPKLPYYLILSMMLNMQEKLVIIQIEISREIFFKPDTCNISNSGEKPSSSASEPKLSTLEYISNPLLKLPNYSL